MIRSALFHSVRCASRSSSISPARRVAPCLSASLKPSLAPSDRSSMRHYAAAAGLQEEEVQGRIMDLLKNFDKVKDTTKLSPQANFGNDLGLDSLDTVEVVMAIEEEFSIEIPDKEADAILSIDKAVDYILKQPDAH